MTEHTLSVRGVDTLLFRDGRPFTADPGSRADTLLIPPPSTLAGFLRTTYGRRTGGDWSAISERLRVRGPLLQSNAQIILPAPADAFVYHPANDRSKPVEIAVLRPGVPTDGAGTDIPGAMEPLRIEHDEKPARGHQFWPWPAVEKWLREQPLSNNDLRPDLAPPVDERVYIQMDPATGASEEGKLFSTRMVGYESYFWKSTPVEAQYRILCRVAGLDNPGSLAGPGTLGGENRLATIEQPEIDIWPACPDDLARELMNARFVRMVLATPAIFTYGWQPGWLDRTTKIGAPPGVSSITLKLLSAAVPRRQAVSGWEQGNGRAKPVRWMAPAGAVYFFEVAGGDPCILSSESWLTPVSDDDKDRSDGFGLALWGAWRPDEPNGKEHTP